MQGRMISILAVLLPLQGVITICLYTQGAALGYMLLPLQGVFYLHVELELCTINYALCIMNYALD